MLAERARALPSRTFWELPENVPKWCRETVSEMASKCLRKRTADSLPEAAITAMRYHFRYGATTLPRNPLEAALVAALSPLDTFAGSLRYFVMKTCRACFQIPFPKPFRSR